MKRFLCCLAWWLGAIIYLLAYWLCILIGSLFYGASEAKRKCQPILDQLNKLADCCAGKD
jgi:hypothetical protein